MYVSIICTCLSNRSNVFYPGKGQEMWSHTETIGGKLPQQPAAYKITGKLHRFAPSLYHPRPTGGGEIYQEDESIN